MADRIGSEPLSADQCGAMGLCERRKGHEGKHETSVDRALDAARSELVPFGYGDPRNFRSEPVVGEPQAQPGLDAAWAATEAALPEGWASMDWMHGLDSIIVEVRMPFVNRSHRGRQWTRVRGEGPTPAAALQALATRLRATTEAPE